MNSDKRSEPDRAKNGFEKRHPGMGKIVFVNDDTSFQGRVRKHLRNPPMRTALLIVFIVFAIPIAIAYPRVSGVAQENWSNVQKARERHFVNVTAASWIYPFLRRQAVRMQDAEVPIEWRGVSFEYGPCFPEHMDQLPTGKYSYAIETACKSLHEIQTKYSDDCAQTSKCNIPDEAKVELQIVLDRLKVAFSDANLVQPVTDDQGQIRN
ncbi:hypothetical protein [Candidatus Lucifugimonas marina]|uniref:Uncharacterized protein n=1 Tax=Candidatus Lucifugimonas marina TaxID=3038979 RepID=A0AAJ6CRB2_9CHLR|nr:hypothetical protein [SAR202 cluster bacterium JH702]MDG0869564.1 hypothetical protein [SAR202 cluster bacterium JH639]WFG34299.1 hypothetical protein GKN94_00910 [SAR202 cluster bacterium JH545]WFG38228.1 hypothetical protein GKO48_00925 [SAR202 cluster bacterium JH1073]